MHASSTALKMSSSPVTSISPRSKSVSNRQPSLNLGAARAACISNDAEVCCSGIPKRSIFSSVSQIAFMSNDLAARFMIQTKDSASGVNPSASRRCRARPPAAKSPDRQWPLISASYMALVAPCSARISPASRSAAAMSLLQEQAKIAAVYTPASARPGCAALKCPRARNAWAGSRAFRAVRLSRVFFLTLWPWFAPLPDISFASWVRPPLLAHVRRQGNISDSRSMPAALSSSQRSHTWSQWPAQPCNCIKHR
mmetsp:Transcript_24376/g.73237  ORF Transcript_24376/g.73237 Transcript_24376/m.73237 type:complete len:254 (-) Transcript_24376:996-1757(-)